MELIAYYFKIIVNLYEEIPSENSTHSVSPTYLSLLALNLYVPPPIWNMVNPELGKHILDCALDILWIK